MWAVRQPDGTIAAGWYLLPLRLFLGVTFFFAGLQKIANPQFFDAANPTSIHAQLTATVHSSPISALTRHLLEHANTVGWLIAIGEVAIGAGVLAGLWTRLAAAGGMALSFGLFLTVSFHSSPYYTGSDIVFLFAWTPLLLAGAGGAPAVDTWYAALERQEAGPGAGLTRRAVLSKAAVTGIAAGVVVAAGGLAAALGRAIGGTKGTSAQPAGTLSGGGSRSAPSPSTTSPSGSTPTTHPSGTAIGLVSDVPVGGSASFTDPSNGDPSIVIQQTADNFVAFDAVCPHAGCTVAYQASARIIACPCHGSEFNPRTGDVVRGPAPIGLTKISVVKGADGNLYVPK
jgi:thiosulfate dehydrogenase (quinone) large subunit